MLNPGPPGGGVVKVEQLNSKVVVTFFEVAEYYNGGSNTLTTLTFTSTLQWSQTMRE